jgi:hypothetical protein
MIRTRPRAIRRWSISRRRCGGVRRRCCGDHCRSVRSVLARRCGRDSASILAGSPGELGDAPFNQAPIGGPFQLERLGRRRRAARPLSPRAPFLDELELRHDDSALLTALTKDEVSGVLFRPGLDRRAAEAIDKDAALVRRSLHTTTYSLIYLNQLVPAFADDRVRRALQHGLDRAALIDSVLEGQAVPLDSPIVPGLWAYTGSPEAYAFDKELAASLLDQAGWKLDGDVRKDATARPRSPEASDDSADARAGSRASGASSALRRRGERRSRFVEGVLPSVPLARPSISGQTLTRTRSGTARRRLVRGATWRASPTRRSIS